MSYLIHLLERGEEGYRPFIVDTTLGAMMAIGKRFAKCSHFAFGAIPRTYRSKAVHSELSQAGSDSDLSDWY